MIRIKPSHVGLLHKNMGIPKDKPIPVQSMREKMKNASPAEKKRLVFALNARGWHKSK